MKGYNPIGENAVVATAVVAHETNVDLEPEYRDPFYASDDTVIASYPFDLQKLDRFILQYHFWAFILFFIFLLDWLLTGPFIIVLLCLNIFFLGDVWNLHTAQNWRRCAHIAITNTGIYVDEVSAPGSRMLMRRRLFKYTEYKHCHVERHTLACGYTEYQVMLTNQADVKLVFVRGLLCTQQFADKVNAMIKQQQQQVATTPTLNAAPV